MTFLKIAGFVLALTAAALFVATQWLARRVEVRFPPIGEFATVDGVRLHFVDVPATSPDLHPIVFLHGASGNVRDLMGAFRQPLEGRARMLFIDRPGAGYSERGGDGMSDPARQAGLVAGLMQARGIERAIVVGHSLGGAVAAAFAVEHPQMTAGLVFIAPATHPWPGGKVTWYYDWVNFPVLGRVFAQLLAVPAGNLLYRNALKGVFAPEPVPPQYAEVSGTRLVLRPASFRHNAADVGMLYGNVERLAKRYSEIEAPTVILTGDKDDVVLAEIHSEGLKRDIAGSRLVWLERTGHMPPYTKTAEIVAEIERVDAEIDALASR